MVELGGVGVPIYRNRVVNFFGREKWGTLYKGKWQKNSLRGGKKINRFRRAGGCHKNLGGRLCQRRTQIS